MADVQTGLDHIVVNRQAQSEGYTRPKGGGGGDSEDRGRSTSEHADRLINQLRAIKASESERMVQPLREGLVRGTGAYVTLRSDPDDVLALDSIDNQREGIDLLAVTVGEELSMSATILIPDGKLDFLIGRVEEYRDSKTPKGEPRHKPLVESIAVATSFTIEDLWADAGIPFPDRGTEVWWEAWLNTAGGAAASVVAQFKRQASVVGLHTSEKTVAFPERTVVLIKGTAEELESSVLELRSVAELRKPRVPADFFAGMGPFDQAEWVNELLDKVVFPSPDSPAVNIIDTGVHRAHPLIEPALSEADMHVYDPAWSKSDDIQGPPGGHGTEMAGLSLYGDLAEPLASGIPVTLDHGLESVRIFPPQGQNEPEVYGFVTQDAVNRVEISAPGRRRVNLMAVSAPDTAHGGYPSSWSSAVDKICYGADEEGEPKRLFVIAAGNASESSVESYPIGHDTDSVHDPGQAWNAVTVGAFTEKDQVDQTSDKGWKGLAPRGGLSPCSTTSVGWDHKDTPFKPDIVMEGGNYGVNPDDGKYFPGHPDSLRLLSTHRAFRSRMLTTSGDTSAAAAQAARLSARIMARYPNLWPETVRGLVVHSAWWTPEMLKPFNPLNLSKQGQGSDVNTLLRRYGYGVPDERIALESAGNALTLIAQDKLFPFVKEGGRIRTNEMNLHDIPWPSDVLRELGNVKAEMRVTLSYFIDPSPNSAGAVLAPTKKFAYASHGLRFDTKTSLESVPQFRRRMNQRAREEGQTKADTSGDSDAWVLGTDQRTRGSVHSDLWRGTALELANKGPLAVIPTTGWWRDRPSHGRYSRSVRYSLVVTIRTPQVITDIYNPVRLLNSVAIPST